MVCMVCHWYVWYATGMGMGMGMCMGMVWIHIQGTARGKVWAKESRLLWMHLDPLFNMASYLT